MTRPSRFCRLAILASLSLTISAKADDITFPGKTWEKAKPESVGLSAEKLEEATAYLKSVVGTDGLSRTMLIRDGYVIWEGDNIGHSELVWSCTKSFLSTCLGLLWDDGKCEPSDLASKYLPEMAKDYPEVTLEHLATFTSGVHLEKGSLDPGKPDYPVGTAMHYSNQSDLLALILTKIAGESLETLFQRRIGDPIGIDPNAWDWKSGLTKDGMEINGGAGSKGGGVHIDASNMARFGWLYANGGNWNGKQLISKRYIDFATKLHVASDVPAHDPKGWYNDVLPGRYGLNWWLNGVNKPGKRLWPTLPPSTFAAQGNKNNICIIIPEWKMVLVRLAADNNIDVGLYDGFFEILMKETPEIAQQ